MIKDAMPRRITTWLAIVGYTLVASGLPLPLGGGTVSDARGTAAGRLAAKDRSRPFPCMDKPCGCDTADRCFTSCCCHTPVEMLAWARARGVEPGVLQTLERRVSGGPRTGEQVRAASSKASCCSTAAPRAESSCCATTPTNGTAADQAPDSSAGPAVCHDARWPVAVSGANDDVVAVADENERSIADDSSQQRRSRSVTLRAMLACGGIGAEWFTAAALPPPCVEVSLPMRLVDEQIVADVVGAGCRTPPDAPPPRAA